MADDNIEEGETNEISSLALDSNKQKEFEDKVKRISTQVSRRLCLLSNKKYFESILMGDHGMIFCFEFEV